MEQVVEGFLKNGEIILFEDIKFKNARVRIILQEEKDDFDEGKKNFLLKNKLKIRTKGFKFDREELYDRKSLH